MTRRVKTTFTATVKVNAEGLEYYVWASDGTNENLFPAKAQSEPLSVISEGAMGVRLAAPVINGLTLKNKIIQWSAVPNASYYNIYRSAENNYTTGPDNLLTYLSADALLNFIDNGEDFKGEPLKGNYNYRITAVDKNGYESAASKPLLIKY